METWIVMAGFPLLAIVMAIVWVVNGMWLVPRRLEKLLRRQGLRGNSYRFFYGDLKDASALFKQANSKPINISDDIVPRCIPAVHKMLQIHGKNSFSWMGPIPRLFIYNPEQIKEIFVRNNEFVKPGSGPLSRLLVSGVVTYDGEKWMKHRRLINPAFHLEKLKKMLPAFDVSCSNMVGKWESLVSEKGFCEVDVWPHIVCLTSDAISRTAFGSSYEEGMRIFQLQDEQGRLLLQVIRSAHIPGWRFLPTKLNKRTWTIDKEIKASLKTLIDKREKAMRKGEAANDDLLGILLESNSRAIKEHGDDKNKSMSLEDIMEECKLFYFAGQETTSVLLVWTVVLLSQHPDWQARAREEVVNIFGKGKPAEFDGLNRLKIVSMIFNEVLRLYPPATVSLRTVHKETKLGDLLVPAGAQVAVPVILVHHDPELWGKDAKEFRPERFSEGISKATKNQVSYLPFGWGPRICVGQNFALLEAKMAMVMILQKFSFELSPSYAHAPHMVLTLRPQHGAHLILHKI